MTDGTIDLAHLIAFNLTLLAAIASPGPALLVAIRTTLASGRRAGVATGAGLGTMAATWTLLALLGLDGLFQLVPWGYMAAKGAGALYLLHIAYRTWKGARAGIADRARPARHAFRDGFLINLLNPKSVLFAAAVLVVIFPAGLGPWEMAIVVGNHLAVELAFYAALAAAMSSETVRGRYLAAKRHLDRGAALLLGALGLRLLVDR